VGPIAVLDAVVKRKIPSPRRESNHRTPITFSYTLIARNIGLEILTDKYVLEPSDCLFLLPL